jgi:DNA (cytosine-5)-methyltransferase 1
MTFGSLFAGIGGFDLGLERAGMECLWQVEKDVTAGRVLGRHWPSVPRFEDVLEVGRHNLTPVDVVCGGFPCQDLSVAGKGAGIERGTRSGLFFELTRVVDELRPCLLVWENVPGLLSNRGGRDFLTVLVELDRIGYSGAWTGLDAQFFGLAQRRRRIFGVFARGDFGAERGAEILALAQRLSGNPPPRREQGKDVAACLTSRAPSGSRVGQGWNSPIIAYQDAGGSCWREGRPTLPESDDNGTNHLVAATLTSKAGGKAGRAQEGDRNIVAIRTNQTGANGTNVSVGVSPTLDSAQPPAIHHDGVRRLTPVECERLQGFPDGWTAGESDSARYWMLGNAVAVPVAEWVGRRIVEAERRRLAA